MISKESDKITVIISVYFISVLSLIFNVSYVQAEINNATLAVLVNKNDPESMEIARYYQKARLIPDENIIYMAFRAGVSALTEAEFAEISAQLRGKVRGDIQAFALAWRKPWRVACMSITSAFSLGFNKAYCSKGCKVTKVSRYFNSQSRSPYAEFAFRPSMLLSADSVDGVKKLIDRGVSSDYVRPVGTAYLLNTSDKNRNVRAPHFPRYMKAMQQLLNIELVSADALRHKKDVMFYFTGRMRVKYLDENRFLPGSIADHLTSLGGHLFNGQQMSALEWISAGATGTYGAVVEPCNFKQKFPVPGIVMQKYLSGETLIEAYWKSVRMPGQGLFVGEPLASPYKGCQVMMSRGGVFQYKRKLPGNFVESKNRNCN